jgi:magnesium-transporting ATPase (P-type)
LTDDNFSSIVGGIEEGRAIFENIKRFMAYILSSNPQEMYPYIFWMLLPDVPLAMTVMGILAVDLGTDLIPAMGLGMEPPEKGIMERPPRSRNESLLSLKFILRSYFVQGSLVALSCYATYYYMGWVLGYWKPGRSLAAMPGEPPGVQLAVASTAYLQTLTAYFFPTVTTQIANVLCRRSWKTSLFSRDFLRPERRAQILREVATWRPRRSVAYFRMDYRLPHTGAMTSLRSFLVFSLGVILLPLNVLRPSASRVRLLLEKLLVVPLSSSTAGFLERHPIMLNLLSNPLIDVGILFELFLCYLLFYSPLAQIYFFAPVPWHVYLFAFHGTVLLLIFEEVKKYYRRRGHTLEFLG